MPASAKASFTLRGRNPDVLTCIANLSNDEVFTPPEFAGRMLDTLAEAWAADHDGANLWADSSVRFLDPCTKSGVFLREITRRLTEGLAEEMPDLDERVNHILTKQVFGIGITQLTSLLARRSLYCSKEANGEHSIAKSFDTEEGNIWFERQGHTWVGNKCKYCGAPEDTLNRGDGLETYAYALIHTDNSKNLISTLFGENMQFDVVIGNPPYQLNDGGGNGSSALPIYQKFVERAKELDPKILMMLIPSRWFTGGKGLDDFRETMLNDRRISYLADYPISADVFPKNGPKGGVCFFVWHRDAQGKTNVTTHFQGTSSASERPLLESGSDVFIRFNEGIGILRKIAAIKGSKPESIELDESNKFINLVSTRKPFGFSSDFRGREKSEAGDITLIQKGGRGFISPDEVKSGKHLIDKWKIYVGFAAPGTGDKDTYPHRIISTPFIGEPGTVSTETYLCIGPFETRAEADSALSYMKCKLTRFLILLHKPSQNTTRHVYTFVPTQTWDKQWTDEELYKAYGLSAEEIEFVEKIVRPMEGSDD